MVFRFAGVPPRERCEERDRVITARIRSRTVIPVSPQGKTGISLTQARGRKDEIPALRFAWPGLPRELDTRMLVVWLSILLSNVAFFQPTRQTTACAYTKAVIPVSPQGKTGISQTQARARKDEIPARRFAWPE